MFEDFEFDPKVIGLSLAFWLFICILIWKVQLGDAAWTLPNKIMITVGSLPIVFLAVNWQANR